MSVHIQPLSTLPQLRGLLEVTRLVGAERDLTQLFDRIAETISESLGFGTVAINLYRPAEGDFEVTAVHGNEIARQALLGTTRGPDAWAPYLSDRFLRRGAYLIPHDEADWEGAPSHVLDLPVRADPDAWHPGDAMIVPMRGADGALHGVVSVDEPESGLRPSDEELDVLVAIAAHLGTAVEAAQSGAASARHRGALEQLLRVSSQLPDARSSEELLQHFCDAIRSALGFQNVAAELFDDQAGHFRAWAAVGWAADGPELRTRLTRAEAAVLLDPAFEQEGCFLLPLDEALARLPPNRAAYASQLNGIGPLAWNRHWLIVPLRHRNGELLGYVWVDEPADRLLPLRDVLTLLRTFANQAAAGLHAAADFQQLARRNDELAALHETTVGLLAGLEVDSVLDAILSNAAALLSAPYGFLYLPTESGDELELRLQRGLEEYPPPLRIARGQGVTGQVLETGEAVLVEDYPSWSRRLPQFAGAPFTSALAVPLRVGGELRGVLGVAVDDRGTLGAADAVLLERFASLASLALEDARLYAALQQSEQLHRRIVECSTDLISLVDLEGTTVVISPSIVGTLGIQPEELVGTYFARLVHPDDLARAEEMFSKAVQGSFATTTVRVRHADGSWVVLEAIANVIVGPDGQPQHILATGRDVTERHRLEEQLRQAQKMESIGRLAGGIAHDFNNLLTAIGGYAELGLADLEAGATEGAAESIAQISRASTRAAQLTAQLLAFSRKQVLHLRELDLNETVSDMASMLARMLGEDIVLSADLDPELWPVLADPGQLEQVVLNLAINARDAMPSGGNLAIRTSNLELSPGEPLPAPELLAGSYVLLRVADTGVGMASVVAARIFEPFFTTKDVGQGTGLGLATVHGIVSQSGGAVWAESTLGEGTCFSICLPRVSV